MSVSSPLPKDHPTMLAWESFKASEDYKNAKRWAEYAEHVEGSLWAAFVAGRASVATPVETRAREPSDTELLDFVLTGWESKDGTPFPELTGRQFLMGQWRADRPTPDTRED